MAKSNSTMQEYRTTLAPDAVKAQAKQFFSGRQGIYSAFLDKEGPNWASFRGQGGEEVVIAASPADGATLVTGSSYLFDMQVTRFFETLPVADAQPVAAATAAALPPTDAAR
jgi:hypothetical protein